MRSNYISSRILFGVIYFQSLSYRQCRLYRLTLTILGSTCRTAYPVDSDLFPCDWQIFGLKSLHEVYSTWKIRTFSISISISQKIVYASIHKHTHYTHIAMAHIHVTTIMRIAVTVELFSGKSTSSFYAFYLLDRLWNPMRHLINMYVNVLSLRILFFQPVSGEA